MNFNKYFVFFDKIDFVIYINPINGSILGIRSNYGWNEISF